MKDFTKFMQLSPMRVIRSYESLECVDGTKISIQAGEDMFSTPTANVSLDVYTHFEICVDLTEELAKKFELDPSDSIQRYVPKRIVADIIAELGGLKKEKELMDSINNEKEVLSGIIEVNIKKNPANTDKNRF